MGRSRSNTTAASRSSEPRAVRHVRRQRRLFHHARNGAEAADYSGFERRRQESARQGKLRGIGIATYIEACAMAPSVLAGQLGARGRFLRDGGSPRSPNRKHHRVNRYAQPRPRHETTFVQVVAEALSDWLWCKWHGRSARVAC
jgi:CO/xanthine dehydrogenase Mo-binding subunit